MVKDKGRKEVEKRAKQLKTLKVEYIPVQDLHPNNYNPNRQSDHDFGLLLRSMREDGFTQPIVVQGSSLTIVDGEHRWRAAQELGYESVPVVKVDMTEEQMKISTLRHNRARGSEDIDLVADIMKDLRDLGALDWAQDSLMLDDVEIEMMLDDATALDGLAGEDYSEAWEPGGSEQDGSRSGSLGHDTSMTKDASDALRDREKRIAAATTAEEKDIIRKDTKVYRVSLVFTNEEASLVKSVLDPKPADALLELCELAKG